MTTITQAPAPTVAERIRVASKVIDQLASSTAEHLPAICYWAIDAIHDVRVVGQLAGPFDLDEIAQWAAYLGAEIQQLNHKDEQRPSITHRAVTVIDGITVEIWNTEYLKADGEVDA